MLLVKTKLSPSTIEGLGLFAAEPIVKGTMIWKYDDQLDRRMREQDREALPLIGQAFIDHFAYKNPRSGMYVLCGDDARFYNHCDSPNTKTTVDDETGEYIDCATRDIREGEEITCDYRVMEGTAVPVF